MNKARKFKLYQNSVSENKVYSTSVVKFETFIRIGTSRLLLRIWLCYKYVINTVIIQ